MQLKVLARVFGVVFLLIVIGWEIPTEVGPFAQAVSGEDLISIATALDANGNNTLNDDEIREAIRLWVTGEMVPSTDLTIDDSLIQDLVRLWITGETIDGAPDEKPFQTLDDQFSEVSRRVPEFGGMFMGANETLHVYLLDTSPAVVTAVEVAIIAVFGVEIIPSGGIQPILAQYAFSQLRGWHNVHRKVTLALPGVVSTSIDEASNRLKLKIEDMATLSRVEQALAQQGIPLDAVDIVESAPVEPLSSHTLRDKQRPLVGGIQIVQGGGGTCTLGFLAVRNGEAGFVTNSHCMVSQGGLLGTALYQPNASSEANRIGQEAADPVYSTGGDCPSGRRCRFSDSAFVRLDMGADPAALPVTAEFGFIALPDDYTGGGMTIDSSDRVRINKEASSIIEGTFVQRVGRTSGATYGEIIDTCEDVNVNGSNVTLFCQHRVEAISGPGDSGSPVFSWTSPVCCIPGVKPSATLYGILWGGGGGEFVFSPISAVQAELGALRTHQAESGANSPPQIKIISPSGGANVGFGGLNIETYEVALADFEDKNTCCQVSWSSDVDGPMGGGKKLEFVLPTAGIRTITATATDSNGATATDSITIDAGGEAPDVFIDKPTSGQIFTIGIPVIFEGNSFDPNEPFQVLSCSSLTWTSNVPGDPFPLIGCNVQSTFTTAGQRKITLTGVDSQGNSDKDSVNINITIPTPNSPPNVSITSPNDNTLLNPNQQTMLTGVADDPDNKSPISYTWTVKMGSTETTIATGTSNDGQTITTPWTPSDHVPHKCGGNTVQLRLSATDLDGMSKSTSVTVTVAYGPC